MLQKYVYGRAAAGEKQRTLKVGKVRIRPASQWSRQGSEIAVSFYRKGGYGEGSVASKISVYTFGGEGT